MILLIGIVRIQKVRNKIVGLILLYDYV